VKASNFDFVLHADDTHLHILGKKHKILGGIALESSKSEFGVTNSKYTLLKGLDDSQSFLGYVYGMLMTL